MQAPNSGRLPVLLLCAAVVFAVFYATSAITPSFASEGDGHAHADEAPTLETLTESIADLEARIAGLEDELAAEKLAHSIFDAVSAAYLLDKVDIHALNKRLKGGEGIMPGDSGQIKYLVPLLSAVDWPQELAEEAGALAETLTKLTAALADDDLESALPLSSTAHDEQHHFTNNVFDWFACLQLLEEGMEAEEQGEGEQSETSHDDHGHSHDHDESSDDNGAQDGGNDNCVEDESNGTQDDGHDHDHSHGG